MYDGFVERAEAVTRTLSDRRTTFVVVSTLEASPCREAEFFVGALARRRFPLGAVVLNKALPGLVPRPGLGGRPTRLCAEPARWPRRWRRHAAVGEPAQLAWVLGEVGESFLNFEVVAIREAEQRSELGGHADVVATVPYADHDITDLAGRSTANSVTHRAALALTRETHPMATLAELARFFTRLDTRSVAHLQRLAASWGLLADFCFADLLLFGVVGEPATTAATGSSCWARCGRPRPRRCTGPTGSARSLEEEDRPLVARAYRLGEIIEGETTISPLKERVRVLCIPIRYRERVIGVLTRGRRRRSAANPASSSARTSTCSTGSPG